MADTPRLSPLKIIGQACCFGLFMLLIGYFSNSPSYRHLAEDQATIKLSLRHAGRLLGECRRRSAEELKQLPANMRAPEVCPRERSPLLLELALDGELVLSEQLQPRGLHDDGMASAYRRLTVAAGAHQLEVRMKDHLAQQVFPYRHARTINLAPAQVLVIDFDSKNKRFTFL